MAVAVRSVIDGVLIQRATYGEKVDLAEASREAVALFEAATRATPDDTVRSKAWPPRAAVTVFASERRVAAVSVTRRGSR
ncbi:hypothetical protein [Nannocystis pusilla]|uniref:hypothetical protein n=1 Tax=Nannocystis pusilla TaxID=889268 RepID=UPI003B7C1C3C